MRPLALSTHVTSLAINSLNNFVEYEDVSWFFIVDRKFLKPNAAIFYK